MLLAVAVVALAATVGGLFTEHWPTFAVGLVVMMLAVVVGGVRDLRGFPPAWARLGSDGVLLSGHEGPRFVSYARMQDVAVRVHGRVARIRIALDGGATTTIRTLDRDLPAALTAALERYRQRPASEPHPALAVSERSFEQWERDLRALTSAADYRAAPPPPESLVRIVEDPRATAEQRIGAAVALSEDRDEGRRLRVRVAIDDTAEPELKDALEDAVAGKVRADVLTRSGP